MRSYPKAVVVLAGARTHYQLPLALHESDALERLVTDMYWPAEERWFSSSLGLLLSESIIEKRFNKELGSTHVVLSKRALCASILMNFLDLSLNRVKDKELGKKARELAVQNNANLISTNYHAFEAFRDDLERPKGRFLFQLQADPRTVRRILEEEIELVPAAAASLRAEYELSLPEEEFQQLYREPHLANGCVTSSSFAAQTLIENGISLDKIHVVPYGVDGGIFTQRFERSKPTGPLRVVYVGRLIQLKGISYLLDAIRKIKSDNVHLTLCTRGFIDKDLLNFYKDLNITVKIGLSGQQLAQELHRQDVFVFPSLSEGFAHVILETMSCGLPVITTDHTCGPDVIEENVNGFIVPIRDVCAITEKLEWCLDHRDEVVEMGRAAAERAKFFTWERFRAGIRDAYVKMSDTIELESK